MSTTSNRLGKRAKKVTDDLEKMGETVRDAAQAKLGQLGESVSKSCELGRNEVLQASRTVEHSIQAQPILSLLIAVGVGVLLGSFWTIRRR